MTYAYALYSIISRETQGQRSGLLYTDRIDDCRAQTNTEAERTPRTPCLRQTAAMKPNLRANEARFPIGRP